MATVGKKLSSLPDTGDRTAFNTGAVRDAMKGKGIPSMIPTEAIYAIARRFEDGATKYGADNWRKGIPLSRYCDSAYRHLMAFGSLKGFILKHSHRQRRILYP